MDQETLEQTDFQLRNTLRGLDCAVQGGTEKIQLLAAAASSLLTQNSSEHKQVRLLLELIEDEAFSVMNTVNGETEVLGANWKAAR